MIKDTFYQRLGYTSSEDRRGLAGFQARILLKIPKAKKDSKYPQEYDCVINIDKSHLELYKETIGKLHID